MAVCISDFLLYRNQASFLTDLFLTEEEMCVIRKTHVSIQKVFFMKYPLI